MQIDLEELIERFNLDEDIAVSVQEDIEVFADWINQFGPVKWYSGETVEGLELSSKLVWTPGSGNDEWISNGFEDSDYPEALHEGYFLASQPCDEDPYSVFVTTGLWIDCSRCEESEDESEDCNLCEGQQCFLLDISDLFDEIQVQQP